ncbi:MAG TPA: hemolysin family protein [Rubricoccaceae bacterium]|nr:hemolysin family protein [Rubricoccaceae bacterium]
MFAWTVIILLTLVLALYVAAEFAAVSVRHGQVRSLAQKGNRIARRLLPTLEDAHRLDAYIAACQIGITLSTLVTGAFAQATVALDLADVLEARAGMQAVAAHSAAAVTVLLALTTLQMVFGELVPKSLALQFPTRIALVTYLPTRWSAALYRPFIGALNGSGWLILRALGLSNTGSHRHVHSPEEIEMLIAESSDGGLLEPDEKDRLRRALRLGRKTARQLMVPRRKVEALDVHAPPEAVLAAATDSPYTRFPVYEGTVDNVVGMLHTKDVATRLAQHGGVPAVAPLLRPILRVPGSLTADRLLTLLREHRARQAVVIDEYGGMEGLVTYEDVLAELVGDVADEFKGEEPAPERLPDGRVRLPGALRLDEAAEWTGVRWDPHGAVTVGGRVVEALGRIPEGGERLRIDGVEVEVEEVVGQAVAAVLVTPPPPDDDGEPEGEA